MLQKRRSKSPKVYAVFAVLLAFSWTQIEASPLKGNTDENGQKESTEVTSGYKPGVIEVGRSPKHSGDDSDYQADAPGWYMKGQQQINAMFPWVGCGNNDMKFSAIGGQSKHFTMNPMSPTCGSNMQRNPFGVVVRVPYDGCNVEISDGWYNLPLLWNDIPVTAKCPKSDPTTAPTTIPWIWLANQQTVPTQYPPFPWHPWPVPQETTPAAPQNPFFPMLPPGLQHQHPYPWVFPSPAPSQDPVVPQFPGVWWHKHPFGQAPVPSQQDPLPKYWWWYKHMHKLPMYPGKPMDPQYPYGKPWLMSSP